MSLLTSQVIGRANAPLPSACVPGIDLWLDPEFHETAAFRGLMRTHISAPLVCEPVRSTQFIDENQFQFEFKGHEALYRYWDGTHCAEFMARATKQAIEQHLKEETVFLTRYDAIYRRIDQAFDIPNTDLSRLVMFCLDQNGRLSNHRRKQYQHRVPEEIFDALEQAYQSVVAAS